MKKIFLLFLALLALQTAEAQKSKKKKTVKKTTTVSGVSATAENYKAEYKAGVLVLHLSKTDTVHVKTKGPVSDLKLIPFTAKGTKLICINWVEKKESGDVKTKLEKSVSVHHEVYDPATKANLFSNTKTDTDITEVVFLDKVKVVSETQFRKRHEGSDFAVLPDGDLEVKGKSSVTRYTYHVDQKKFMNKK